MFMSESYEKTKIEQLINGALGNIKTLVDMETVIGDAIDMGNDCKAYPIIKISVGIVAGGGEYSNKLIIRRDKSYPFAGGTGAGFTAEPIGFLVSRPDGCEMITVQSKNAMSNLMEKMGDVMANYLKKVANKTGEEVKDDK